MTKKLIALIVSVVLVIILVVGVIFLVKKMNQKDNNITGPSTPDDIGIVQVERLETVKELMAEIKSRPANSTYSFSDALVLSMNIVTDENGDYVKCGHNVPEPGVEVYSMDSYPGGWNWKADEQYDENGKISAYLLMSGSEISFSQHGVIGGDEHKEANFSEFKLKLCVHGDALLSPCWTRDQGAIEVVKFSVEQKTALVNTFKWWYETDDKGQTVIKVGFTYCNDAPEGETIIPTIVPSL